MSSQLVLKLGQYWSIIAWSFILPISIDLSRVACVVDEFTFIHRHNRHSPSSTVIHRHPPSSTVIHRHSPSLNPRHAPSCTVIHRHSPSSTVIHRHSSSLDPRHAPSYTAIHRHSPSYTVNYHHLSSFTVTHRHSLPYLVRLIFTDLVRCGTSYRLALEFLKYSVQMSSQLVIKLGQFWSVSAWSFILLISIDSSRTTVAAGELDFYRSC